MRTKNFKSQSEWKSEKRLKNPTHVIKTFSSFHKNENAIQTFKLTNYNDDFNKVPKQGKIAYYKSKLLEDINLVKKKQINQKMFSEIKYF